jgi:hypothetical protein
MRLQNVLFNVSDPTARMAGVNGQFLVGSARVYYAVPRPRKGAGQDGDDDVDDDDDNDDDGGGAVGPATKAKPVLGPTEGERIETLLRLSKEMKTAIDNDDHSPVSRLVDQTWQLFVPCLGDRTTGLFSDTVCKPIMTLLDKVPVAELPLILALIAQTVTSIVYTSDPGGGSLVCIVWIFCDPLNFCDNCITGKHQQMIVCFNETLTLLFEAFLTDDKVPKDNPSWPKIHQEVLRNGNMDRRLFHLAMRHVPCPRAVLVALLQADPDLQQTLQRQTLPPTDKRPVPLSVFVLMQVIPGLDVQVGEQLRQFAALPIQSHSDTTAVAREIEAMLNAYPLQSAFSVQVFSPVAHSKLTAAAQVCGLWGLGLRLRLGGWGLRGWGGDDLLLVFAYKH